MPSQISRTVLGRQFKRPWFRNEARAALTLLWLLALGAGPCLHGQPSDASSGAGPAEQPLAALHLELTNAWSRVLKIVNQPVAGYARRPKMRVSEYAPGWFHPGAGYTPDFNNVDIRQTQDTSFGRHEYVTSDVTPGVVFLGRDLEFNPMTKLFYTNHTLPKHKLSDAEMVEINSLYRIIGRCRGEIDRLQTPAINTNQPASVEPSNVEPGEIVPGQSFEFIRKIPWEKRALYGGIAIGALILLWIAARLARKRGR